MKHLFIKYAWLPVLFLLASCWKEPNYPKEPEIEFKSISARTKYDEFKKSDVVELKITLKFKDGDGNLGLDNSNPLDSLAPYDFNEGKNRFHHNYFIEAFYENNGQFVPLFLAIPLNGRFPLLNPDGKLRALEGDLTYSTSELIVAFLPFRSGTRMKFRVSIADRQLNVSNIVETEPVEIIY